MFTSELDIAAAGGHPDNTRFPRWSRRGLILILAISGSLRQASSNTVVSHAAARLASADVQIELNGGLPLLGRSLDSAGIAADPELGPALRRALEVFAAAL